MPKQKITREMVVDAAFEIARNKGLEEVLVKNIADKLGCSVQPIYSYCQNIENLRQEVVKKVHSVVQEFVAANIDKNDMFRSTGKSYIKFAVAEPNLYRIFISHQRSGLTSLDDFYRSEVSVKTTEFIANQLGISIEKAKMLHLNMLIYNVGIGTIFAATVPGVPTSEIYQQLEIAYDAFLQQALRKE